MRHVLCKLKKQVISSSLAVALGVGAVAASTAQAAEHNWRFANLYTRGTAFGEVYGNLATNIEEMSGGRIKVKMMYAGEGVDTKGILGAVKSGLITMGATFQPMNAGELPAGIVEVGLPGGTADVGKLSVLFHEKGWNEVLTKAYGEQGLQYLEPYVQPPVYLLTKKEIKSVEDFKGLKLRAPGAYGKFVRNLGASPVSLTWSEIYTGLATGVIDGSIGSNLIDHRDGNHAEVAKYMYRLPLAGAQVLPVVVNKRAWDKLPDDLKAIVKAATAVHARDQMTKSRLWESQAIADMEAKGMKWSPEPSKSDQDAWAKAGENLWNEYSKSDKFSAELVEILKKQ